ncbi:hypothetical protein CCR75_005933 [Bremia lactucae]|uniref:Uncharacterized protein n=1 Tax=Bremia lactucae TaxID=4779 RepID=A0A976P017_BRELC|nr:hypothetical protein CCR75_005933 [Bremia lactucae]
MEGSGVVLIPPSNAAETHCSFNQTPSVPVLLLERIYDGCISGTLADKGRVLLRIMSDGTLQGEARRPVEPVSREVMSSKKRSRRVIAEHPDGVVVAHISGYAHVVPLKEAVLSPCSSTESCNGTSPAEYCCVFEVTKRLHHVDRHSLSCHLHVPLAPNVTALGTWRLLSGQTQDGTPSPTVATNDEVVNKEGWNVFQLLPVQKHRRQQEAEERTGLAAKRQCRLPSLLYPLRPGKYEFQGFTTCDMSLITSRVTPRQRNRRRGRSRSVMTLEKDKCLVTLRLLPDGTLRGTSREVVQPQACPLSGSWQANRLAYVLEYRVREAVGHFRYTGAVIIEGSDGNEAPSSTIDKQNNAQRRERLCGSWYNVDDGHAVGYEGGRGKFELELVRVEFTPITVKIEQIEHALVDHGQSRPELDDDDDDVMNAFTTGKYELSGCATDVDGYEYAFTLQLQLLPGGKLVGHCRERVFDQTSPVLGSWNPRRLTYGQRYVVKHEVGRYTYTAEMSSHGAEIRGSWRNTEEEFAFAPSEHGTFALIILDSTRQWSTYSHAHYPPSFRRGVLMTLMASARTNALPVSLWISVFAFCSESWFYRQEMNI